MSYLLDTQVAIYAIAEEDKLSAYERAIIDDDTVRVFVSLVTIWEIAIKNSARGRGRNPFPLLAEEAMRSFESSRFEILPIASKHVCSVENLASIHRDPFDRLLVAQAKSEKINLVTRDKTIHRYFAP